VSRLTAWWRYRHRLAALLAAHEDRGYRVSPVLYRRLQGQAHATAISRGTEKGA